MAVPRRLLSATLLAVLAGAGCGSSTPPGSDGGGTDRPAGGDNGNGDGGAGGCTPGGAPVDLTGTWAARVQLAVELTQRPGGLLRLCPDPQATSARLLIRMGIRATGGHLVQSVQVCQVSLPQALGGVGGCPAQPLSIRLAPAPSLTAYIPRVVIPDITTELGSIAPCSAYDPQAFTVLLGVRAGALGQPDTDALPAWCSPCGGATAAQCVCQDCGHTGAGCAARDSDVEDSDGDGHPGVSVAVSTGAVPDPIAGEAYLAFRTRPRLNGTILGVDRIAGAIEATLDYAVVGSGVQVVGNPLDPAALTGALPEFRIVPDGSEFVMLRADGGALGQWDANGDRAIDCADIVARANNFDR